MPGGEAGPRPREDDSPGAAEGANTVGRRSFPASKATLAPQEESASRAVVPPQEQAQQNQLNVEMHCRKSGLIKTFYCLLPEWTDKPKQHG
ncbi:hypothetical protein NDU88_010375 [Pleurodeles waltl]|uniref:Uncharacterized protein n=1 Tax=Pleurodeles waltl TaxID=8319 RepID=A0AAV7R037_PLEWA|nr:hypothetical protein NDU88_010375 [Pleurodeles waltl]